MSTNVRNCSTSTARPRWSPAARAASGLQIAEALGEAGAKMHADVAQGRRPRRGGGAPAGPRHRRALDRRRCERAERGRARRATRRIERLGHVDILVNNAGATWGAPAEDHPLEAWDKVMNLNVRSIFLCSQAIGKRQHDPAPAAAASSTSRRSPASAATRRAWRRSPTTPARARWSTSRARWPPNGASTASPSTRSRRASSRAG